MLTAEEGGARKREDLESGFPTKGGDPLVEGLEDSAWEKLLGIG